MGHAGDLSSLMEPTVAGASAATPTSTTSAFPFRPAERAPHSNAALEGGPRSNGALEEDFEVACDVDAPVCVSRACAGARGVGKE